MRNILLVLCLLAAPVHIGFCGITDIFPIRQQRINWEKYLPGIVHVESRGRQWARSYLGESFGRGYFGISEICFEHWRWYHENHWVVKQGLGPDCLYNSNVGQEVALWYLGWLDGYYAGRSAKLALVLSAYNQGAAATDRIGITWAYVDAVLQAL